MTAVDEYESLWREADRRYSLALLPRVRLATITDAVSPSSYSILLPGEGTARTAVPSVSAVIPQVGQLVRLELVGDDPVIVDVLGGLLRRLTADVTTSQSSSSTSYVDLATTGPAVTCDLVAGQSVLVAVSCRSSVSPTSTTFQAQMSFAVSGVESLTASDANAAENTNTASLTVSRSTVYTAAVTGSHTFTSKYRVINATTGTWLNRRIVVTD